MRNSEFPDSLDCSVVCLTMKFEGYRVVSCYIELHLLSFYRLGGPSCERTVGMYRAGVEQQMMKGWRVGRSYITQGCSDFNLANSNSPPASDHNTSNFNPLLVGPLSKQATCQLTPLLSS